MHTIAHMSINTTGTGTDSYLVERGARLDLVNCDGELPLDLAYQFAREGDASEAESEASDDEHDADAGAARRAHRASSKSSKSSGTWAHALRPVSSRERLFTVRVRYE